MDTYEKKYNEILAWAKKYKARLNGVPIEEIFPELAESEDEKIRKKIEQLIRLNTSGAEKTHLLAWLEKQKENPKNAISIPADCASNAKCPYKIHGEGEFIGDIHDSPAYWRGWDDAMKHKESLHIPETCKENAKYFTQCGDNRFELIDKAKRDIIEKTSIESSPDEMKVLDSFLFRAWQMGWLDKYDVTVPEQKPAEWSEEDELIRNAILGFLNPDKGGTRYSSHAHLTEWSNWLKSLRPSWKPSEEQMEALAYAIQILDDGLSPKAAKAGEELEHLREQLKKL